MSCLRWESKLVDVPDFSLLYNSRECLVGHNTQAQRASTAETTVPPSATKEHSGWCKRLWAKIRFARPATPAASPFKAAPSVKPGTMISTVQLSESAKKSCPWCDILWTAFRRAGGTAIPGKDDFIFWRYDGESFFEPWCSVGSGENNCKIEIYTSDDPYSRCNIPEFPRKRFLLERTDSGNAIDQILEWQRQCQSHDCCSESGLISSTLPSRLIDVGFEGENFVRLIETKEMMLELDTYICLSHCWGSNGMPIETTNDTIQSHKQGIPMEVLPATFRHAVEITRRLGCRFLWIDSLCIKQHDDEDWRREASQMASIYRNSWLTIAAAAAKGPTEGLFFLPTHGLADTRPLVFGHDGIPFPVYVRPHVDYSVGHVKKNQKHTLLERGWVLQERLLSSRVVYFGANEVSWECMLCSACQCEPVLKPYPPGTNTPQNPFNPKAAFTRSLEYRQSDISTNIVEQRLKFWHYLVNTYTKLNLSYPKDKYPAIAGLASEIERFRPDDSYLAGLWSSTFMHDLLWRKQRMDDIYAAAFGERYDLHNVMAVDDGREKFHSEWMQREFRQLRARNNFPQYAAPTWSWASLEAQIEYDKETNLADFGIVDPEFAGLVEVHCDIVSAENPKGQFTAATYVILNGKLYEVEYQQVKISDPPLDDYQSRLYRNNFAIGFADQDLGPISGGRCGGPRMDYLIRGQTLYCLEIVSGMSKAKPEQIRHIYGLVLRKKGEEPGAFERVGMFHQAYEIGKEFNFFDGVAESTRVKIF